jgi:hypothetical protein
MRQTAGLFLGRGRARFLGKAAPRRPSFFTLVGRNGTKQFNSQAIGYCEGHIKRPCTVRKDEVVFRSTIGIIRPDEFADLGEVFLEACRLDSPPLPVRA